MAFFLAGSRVLVGVHGDNREQMRTSTFALQSRFGRTFLSLCRYSLHPLQKTQLRSPHVENLIWPFFNELNADSEEWFDKGIGRRKELQSGEIEMGSQESGPWRPQLSTNR